MTLARTYTLLADIDYPDSYIDELRFDMRGPGIGACAKGGEVGEGEGTKSAGITPKLALCNSEHARLRNVVGPCIHTTCR